jgi:hypothetical protein
MKLIFLILLGMAISFLTPKTYAGKVKVVNENKHAVWFRLIPQEHHIRPKYNLKVSRKSHKYLNVTSKDIAGKTIYSIEGEKKYGGDSCINLSVDKDYLVTFKRNKIGTTCIAEEIHYEPSQSSL